jgi:monoamine oxidase
VLQLIDGQSHLAKRIFDEAVETGNLCYSFESIVSSISDRHGSVEVVTDKGAFKATKVVSTIPTNVYSDIKFEPELSPLRREAFETGHNNFGNKIVRTSPRRSSCFPRRADLLSLFSMFSLFQSALGNRKTRDAFHHPQRLRHP